MSNIIEKVMSSGSAQYNVFKHLKYFGYASFDFLIKAIYYQNIYITQGTLALETRLS